LRPVDVLLAISVPVIWATGFVLAKVALQDFPPILLISLRFALTAFVLVWFFRPPIPVLPKIFLISVIAATLQYILTFNGLKYLDASTAGLLLQAEVPMCALLAALMLKERITLKMGFGMALAFVGVVIIAGEPKLEGNEFAVLLVLGGALFWSLGQVMTRQLGQISGFVLITWIAVFATPQMFMASWILEDNQIEAIRNAGWEVWLAVVYMGLVMTAIGYAIWYNLLNRFPVNKVAPFLLLLPVTILVESVLFLGEQLTWFTIVGGILTILGVAVLVTSDPNSKPA